MGILDDVLGYYNKKTAAIGQGVNSYLHDADVATQPGMLSDVGGYLKEKATAYPSGAVADESTPTLDKVLNAIYNVSNTVVDPENPAGSMAMTPGIIPSKFFKGGPIET